MALQPASSTANLLPPFPAVQPPCSFSDAPEVGPTAVLSGAVLRVGLPQSALQTLGGGVRFTAVIHAPRRLKAATYYTDGEKSFASERIAAHWLARPKGKDRKLAKKLKASEVGRKFAADEVLAVHDRFLKQLEVLSDLWRGQLKELLAVEDNSDGGEGAELVQGIFPYLDAMERIDWAARNALALQWNHVVNLDDAEHSGNASLSRTLNNNREGGPCVRAASCAASG